MISTGDNFRKRIAKRCLTACLLAAFACSAGPATAEDQKAAKKEAAPVKTATAPKAGTSTVKTSPKVKVIEFGAPWCVPCKVFAPIFTKLKAAYRNDATFETVDIDTEDGEKVANKYGISSVPAIIIVDNTQKVVMKKSGINNMTEKILTAELNKALGK